MAQETISKTVFEKLIDLSKQLYPKGRAFKMPYNGVLEQLHRGLAASEERAYNDALSLLYDILPDNEYFTEDDATAWEKRLGLITNPSTPLEDRKMAIARKMNFPGQQLARQNYLYLQGQLQAAGFDVYVYENIFDDGAYGVKTKTPSELLPIKYNQHGQRQHGQIRHGRGYGYVNKVANYIEENLDKVFDVGSNYRSTFFIGGNPLGSFANVIGSRKAEFRQLILKIKPTQTVAYLFINYT